MKRSGNGQRCLPMHLMLCILHWKVIDFGAAARQIEVNWCERGKAECWSQALVYVAIETGANCKCTQCISEQFSWTTPVKSDAYSREVRLVCAIHYRKYLWFIFKWSIRWSLIQSRQCQLCHHYCQKRGIMLTEQSLSLPYSNIYINWWWGGFKVWILGMLSLPCSLPGIHLM